MENIRYFRKIVFFILLFLLPFNIRHIFNYESIQFLEGFRENLTLFLSPFDIGMFLLISTFIWEKGDVIRKKFFSNKHVAISFLLLTLVVVVSSILSENKSIAFYNSIRFFEAIIFFFIAKDVLSQNARTFFQGIYTIFIAGVFQSLIAIFQFISQKSLGLFVLGESHISPYLLGVAKIEHGGEKLVRAYGTFPHPNILGAFLLLALSCGLFFLIQGEEKNLIKRKFKNLIFRFLGSKFNLFKFSFESLRTFNVIIGLFLITSGIVVSFSRVTWLGAAIIFIFFFSKWIISNRFRFATFNRVFFDNKNQKNEDFSVSREQKLLLRDTFFFGALYVVILLVFLSPLIAERVCVSDCDYGGESYQARKEYLDTAINLIQDNPILGVGAGNFVGKMNEYASQKFQPWERQPVHSLYFLIASEIGIVGVIILVYFIIYNIKCNPFNRLLGIHFLVCLLIGLFDHFFVSTFQGQLLFWACLAFFVASCKIEEKDSRFKNF